MTDQTQLDELKADTRQILDQFDTPTELSDSRQPHWGTDTAALKVELDELQAANEAGFQALARKGIQFNGPDTFNLTVRLVALAEYLLGDADQPGRMGYELLVQRKFAKSIDEANGEAARLVAEAQAQAARAKLFAPAPGARPTLDRRRRG